ncbi:MAG: IS256 family transposase [Fermentimonas sp.]
MEDILQKEDGLNTILKLSLEALMKSKRELYKSNVEDYSNGFRIREAFGDKRIIELRVLRTRNGGFYPVILALLKNQEQEASSIAFELYRSGSGLTTERVGNVFGEICGSHYSSSQVSRMFDTAREEVGAWLNRPLEPYYPIVMIDACFIPTRRGDSVSKEAYYTLLAVRPDRRREVLGVYNYPTEGSLAWESILDDLRDRDLERVDLFVSDGLNNIEDAIWKCFPGSEIQLCVVHLQRVFLKEVKPKHKKELSDDFKEVFHADDRGDSKENAMHRFLTFREKWGELYPYFKRRQTKERNYLYFTYVGYHYRIRSMIYSTNWVERLNRDYKRTTRMRGALPNPEATLLLLGRMSMNRKAHGRKLPKLDYEQVKFDWEEEE